MTATLNTERARFNMIEQQIRPWNVPDAEALLTSVKREDFVPPAFKALAFTDTELPLKSHKLDDESGPVMLAPIVQARIAQEVAPQADEKVLFIGAGTGYLAALIAKRAGQVIALEIDAELAATAKANLQKAGITNVEVKQADGAQGLASEAPFDLIVLAGSVAEVPSALLSQLKIGGRLFAVVGDAPSMRATLITRKADAEYQSGTHWDVVIPRLQGFPETPRFKF
jgi:protein-L-isoaspartate(D-aspartate) O-methyltransferase